MKEESKKTLKVLSKILEVVTIIGKVCSIIAIVCIAILMVCLPFFVNNIKISDNKYGFKIGKTDVVLMETGKNDASIQVTVDGKETSSIEEAKIMEAINNALQKTNKTVILAAAETALAFAIATIVFSIIVLNYAIKFFRNLGTKESPFIEENVSHLRKMGKYMIVAFVLEIIASVIVEAIVGHDINSFNTYNVIEVLIVFVLAYIFEYGVELQKSSKKKLFDEEAK